MEGEPNDLEDRDYEEEEEYEVVEDDVRNEEDSSSDEERVTDARLRSHNRKYQRAPSPPPPAPQPDVELTAEQVAANCNELSHLSDFAVVLQFFDLFKSVLNFKDFFTPDKLEHALTRGGKVGNQFLQQVSIKLLRTVVRKHVTPDIWEKTLKNKINRERQFENVTLDLSKGNPLEQHTFNSLSMSTKLSILKQLCEWQLDFNEKVQEYVEGVDVDDYDGTLREDPVGEDSNKNMYWSLDTNEVTARLYREPPPTWQTGNEKKDDNNNNSSNGDNNNNTGHTDDNNNKNNNNNNNGRNATSNNHGSGLPRLVPGEWETVCTTLPQMQQFTESIEKSTAQPEKDLHFIMIDDLLPPLLNAEKKKDQAAKKLAKMEVSGVSLQNIVSGSRARRTKKDVNYSNFVYDNMDFDETLSD